MEWQSIETAPKDGTDIILACFGQISIVPMAWVGVSRWRSPCAGSPLLDDPNGKCVCCPSGFKGEWKAWEFVCAYPPTHWTPLVYPTEEKKDGE